MRDLASRRWLLASQTLGDRREIARAWLDGTYSPPRAPGYPTIYQMPTECDRVPARVPVTYLEIVVYGALAGVCAFALMLAWG